MKHCTVVAALGLLCGMTGSTRAEVAFPSGTQDFESMAAGASVTSIGWIVVNTSAPPDQFTVVAADDPGPPPGLSSSRWLRSTDSDGANVQNRFYSPTITAPEDLDYVWTYYVQLEAIPPGGNATTPKFVIQHMDGGFANAWGIEFTPAGANLVVLGIGGPAASTPLYSLNSSTGVGDWVKLEFGVDFDIDAVFASVNGGPRQFLSMDLSPTANKRVFRFCYRGEGTDNTMTLLLDDVSVDVGNIEQEQVPAISTWGSVILMATLLALVGLKWARLRRTAA